MNELSKSIEAGYISTGSKYNLRLYERKTSELSTEYSLSSFPLSQSWEVGTGLTDEDPNKKDGVTWKSRDERFYHKSWSLSDNWNN